MCSSDLEPKVTAISIDGTPLSDIMKGSVPATTLTATVIGAAGADLTYTWTSSNEDILTIDSSGVVTPVDAGKAIVTAISSDPTKYNGVYLTILPEPTPPETDLELWLDASDLSTITESGGIVSQWDDKSGKGNHTVSVSSPSTGLETLNGRNVISFNSNYMNVPWTNVLPVGDSAYTILGVWKPNGNDQSLLFWGDGSYNRLLAIQANVGGITINHNWLIAAELNSVAGAITAATNTLISYDGTTRRTVSDGVTVSDTTGFAHSMASTPYRGIGGNNAYGYEITNGYIAELMVWHKKLTATEEADLQAYILHKWGV